MKKSKEDRLDSMRLKMDEYNEKYSKARSRLKDLDHQLTFLRQEISRNRGKLKFKSSISEKIYMGADAVKDNLSKTVLLLSNLEKRQHGMLRRKSEWEVLNRERRCTIDKVRHKITRAKNREMRLSKEFAAFQTTFAELLGSCSAVSKDRDHVESQIQSLFNTEEIEVEAYEDEMKKLGDYIREQAEIVEQLKHVGTKVFEQKREDHLTKEEEERLRNKMHHHDDDHNRAARVSKMNIRAAFDKIMDESGMSKSAKTGTAFLKMGHSSSLFKPPRCKTRRNIYDEGDVRPEKLPTSTMNEKELDEDDRDVKMINLSDFRESIRKKMFGQQRDSSTSRSSNNKSGDTKTITRRSASGRVLSSVPTTSRSATSAASSILQRSTSKRGGTAISTASSTRSHISSSRRN